MDLINQAMEKLKNYECEGQLDFLSLVNREVKKGVENEEAGEIDREEKKRPEL